MVRTGVASCSELCFCVVFMPWRRGSLLNEPPVSILALLLSSCTLRLLLYFVCLSSDFICCSQLFLEPFVWSLAALHSLPVKAKLLVAEF